MPAVCSGHQQDKNHIDNYYHWQYDARHAKQEYAVMERRYRIAARAVAGRATATSACMQSGCARARPDA
jgi:hypothetical protein